MKANVIKSGNSFVLQLPHQFNPQEGEAQIEQVGEQWIVRPLEANRWPEHFFEEIRIDDPAFDRPDQ